MAGVEPNANDVAGSIVDNRALAGKPGADAMLLAEADRRIHHGRHVHGEQNACDGDSKEECAHAEPDWLNGSARRWFSKWHSE